MDDYVNQNSDLHFFNKHIGCFYNDKSQIYNTIFQLINPENLNNYKIIFIHSQADNIKVTHLLKKYHLNPTLIKKRGVITFNNKPIEIKTNKNIIKLIETYKLNHSSSKNKKLLIILDYHWLLLKNKIDILLEADNINLSLKNQLNSTLFCLFKTSLLNSEALYNIFNTHTHIIYNNKYYHNIYYNKYKPIKKKKNQLPAIEFFISSLKEYNQLNLDLQYNNEKLMNLITLLPNIFIIINEDGLIKYINDHFLDLTGYKTNMLINKNFFQLFIDKSKKPQLKTAIKKDNILNYEISIKTINNEKKNLILHTRKNNSEIFLIGIDITRRRLIEEKLFDLSKRFQFIFEILPIGLALVNQDGAIFQINEKLKELTGYNEFDLIGEKCHNIICLKKTCLIEKAKRNTKKEEFLEFPRKNKSIYVIRACQKIILNSKIWYLLSFTDVTNIRKVEEEQKYSLKVEQLLNIITFRLINSKNLKQDIEFCFNILGKQLNLNRISIFELFHDDNKNYLKKIHEWCKNRSLRTIEHMQKFDADSLTYFFNERIKTNHNVFINSSIELPDHAVNERIFMEKFHIKALALCPLIYNEQVYGMVSFDVTNKERLWNKSDMNFLILFSEILMSVISKQKIEIQLKQKEAFLKLIIKKTDNISYFVISPQGKIIQWDKSAEKLYGYKEKEILFKDFNFITKDASITEKKLDILKKRGQYITPKPERRMNSNGESILIQETIIILKENKKESAYIVIDKDITNEELYMRELIEAQKFNTSGKLAMQMAHNFNNIFTTINGHLELIFQDVDPDQTIYHSLEKIYSSLNNAIDINNKLLNLHKESSNQLSIININQIVENLQKLIKTLLGEKIKLVIDCDTNLKPIKAIQSQIEQIIINLISNSKEAIQNEGFVVIETFEKNISKKWETTDIIIPPGDYVVLHISDNGPGIPRKIRDRIFKPFFTTKENNKGLGLSIIQNIIKNHSAYIYIGEPNTEDNIVEIYFPALNEELPQIAKTEEKKEPEVQSLYAMNIMLVEDDAEISELLQNVLKDAGATVYSANNGKDALDIIKKKKDIINFLITDIMMPHMNGNELFIQARKIIPQIKVIFTSGYSEAFLKIEKEYQKQTSFLQKPFTAKKLLQEINTVNNKE